jgi:hypothetical protein
MPKTTKGAVVAMPVTTKGKPDARFTQPVPLKNDGTRDQRFKK